MKMRFISTRVHGILDYLSAAVLPIVPRAMGWDRAAKRTHDIVAGGTACASLMTNYELGVVKVLPMRTHLAIDAAQGCFLLLSAAMSRRESRAVRGTMAGVGAFYLLASLTTQTRPSYRRRRPARKLTPIQRVAEYRRPAAAEPLGRERV